MSKNIVAFLIYILLILACTTEVSQQVALPPSDPDIWKKAFDGEDIYVITQGTVAVPLIKLMEEEIPGARWKARFDYDPDISSNYIVIDFQSEKSGTPLDPVIGEMFSGMPVSGTLQVESNRIRMGYFSDDVYTGMTGPVEIKP